MARTMRPDEPEMFRAVLEYRDRKPNPESNWDNRQTVPRYLDEWEDKVHVEIRGPYNTKTKARTQAGVMRARRLRWGNTWSAGERTQATQVVRAFIQRATAVWEDVE